MILVRQQHPCTCCLFWPLSAKLKLQQPFIMLHVHPPRYLWHFNSSQPWLIALFQRLFTNTGNRFLPTKEISHVWVFCMSSVSCQWSAYGEKTVFGKSKSFRSRLHESSVNNHNHNQADQSDFLPRADPNNSRLIFFFLLVRVTTWVGCCCPLAKV